MAVSIPEQHTQPEVVDFRNAAHGPRGYKCVNKRKLDEYEEQVCQWASMFLPKGPICRVDHDLAAEVSQVQAEGLPLQTEVSAIPLPKRRKTNNVVGVGQVRHMHLLDFMTEAQLTIFR